jgi:hypothetical protein
MVSVPTFYPKQLSNLAIAIPTILLGQSDHRQAQFFAIALNSCSISLGAAGYANHFARSSLRCIELLSNINHGLTQIGDRQALGFK